LGESEDEDLEEDALLSTPFGLKIAFIGLLLQAG
jgi:hypothetical protein